MLKVPVFLSKQRWILGGLSLLWGFHGLAPGANSQAPTALPFAVARVYFEHNATDGDLEVVFEAKGGREGLAKLVVRSPDDRTVIDFAAPDATTLGIRQFHFESPEPRDMESLKSAYPEGIYTFVGATGAGQKLYGRAKLTHRLPPKATFRRPGKGARGVVAKNLVIAWAPVRNMAAYIVEIEQGELDVNMATKLPPSATAFAVPEGFLVAGTEYELSIGSVAETGNITVIETTFTTAGSN